jgi:putative membrane protein
MMWGTEGWGWGWWGMGIIHGLLWWAILILGIIVLVRLLGRDSGRAAGAPPAETALDVLKKRYARGEIGKQEFEEKKRDLAT